MGKNIVNAAATSIDDAALGAIGQGGLRQRLMFTFACEGLPSKTDAFCVLWQLKIRKGAAPQKVKLGTTEFVQNNLNPEFVTNVEADFFFEQ